MNLRWLPMFLVLLAVSLAPRASGQGVVENTSVHGHFTLGLSYGPARTQAPCLKLQGDQDFHIARDDCGLAEGVILFSRNFFRSIGDQVWARGVIDLRIKSNMQRNWSDTDGSSGQNLLVSNRNFYVEAGNFLGWGETLWMGNRGYDYEDLWLLDLRLLDQHGPGFGLQDLHAPFGDLALAFFRVSPNGSGPTQDTLDLRVSHLSILEGEGKFALIGTQTGTIDNKSGEKKYTSLQGLQTAFIYQWEDEDLVHKWAVQLGQGLYGGVDQVDFSKGRGIALNETGENRDAGVLLQWTEPEERNAMKKSRSFRVADQLNFTPQTKPWSLFLGVAYEWVDFGGLRYQRAETYYERGDMQTIAYAIRPRYDLSELYSVDVQWSDIAIAQGLGLKHKDDNGQEQNDRAPIDRRLQRASLGFLLRPLAWGYAEMRAYLAYNKWNRASSRDITSGPLQFKTQGVTGGLTFNIWW